MYPSEQDSLEPSGGYPKGTMTLGRSTSRSSNSSRTRAIGSSPNITSSALHHLQDPYEDKYPEPAGTSSLRRQYGRALDPAGQGDAPAFDVQAQLRDLQRENDNLRRELDRGRSCSGTNSVNFWSSDAKRDKGVRREEGGRSMKDQYRPNHEDVQVRGLLGLENGVILLILIIIITLVFFFLSASLILWVSQVLPAYAGCRAFCCTSSRLRINAAVRLICGDVL